MPENGLTQLPGSPGCVVCDPGGINPRSLRLPLYWDDEARCVRIPVRPDATWCGFEGVVHGGMIASVLDEAMAWAVRQATSDWAMTVDFQVRYKKPVTPDRTYEAVAEVSETGRKIQVQARIEAEDGTVMVQASGVFLPARGRAAPRTA